MAKLNFNALQDGMVETEKALILNGLSKQFGNARPAVQTISLRVRENGFLALLGPSGCGKTTILRMIAGFETPSAGTIHLGNQLLSDQNNALPPEQRNMAMVFQSYALWPHMSVADNIGYPLKLRKLSRSAYDQRVRQALESVHLQAYGERKPAELSGGQRQRVALARCLVTEPDIVLLDEPLANLDRHLRAEMEEIFREFHLRSRATMVFVTHDQAEAMALATDIAVLHDGSLQQYATPEELYARPEGEIVGRLIGQGAVLSLPIADLVSRDLDWAQLQNALLNTAPGQARASVLVRPQHVVLADHGFSANVETISFLGERYVLTLRLCDGQSLLAFSHQRASRGERVTFIITHGWRL